MEFDYKHKVIPETLTEEERPEFDYWLQDEYGRHERCIEEAYDQMTKRPLIIPILEGAIKRHQEELDGIIKTRKILEGLWGL